VTTELNETPNAMILRELTVSIEVEFLLSGSPPATELETASNDLVTSSVGVLSKEP
jgi:hypothetical protein